MVSFEQKDEIGEQRRQAEDAGLGQDHMAQQLPIGQANGLARLDLRQRHRFHTSAQHLGEIGAAQKGHGDDRRPEPGNIETQGRQREVDEEQLDQQRRVTRQLHIERHQARQVRRAKHQQRSVDQRHQQGRGNGDQADLQRHTHSLEKRRQRAEDKSEIEGHVQSISPHG